MLSLVTHKSDVLRCPNIDFCCIYSIGSLFYCEQKLCSWHLVTTSMVIALRTLTNDYFLLFSPFAVYRWKNPQHKFLLLLDRQWPMYAQCWRCLFPLFVFKQICRSFVKSISKILNGFGGKEAVFRMKSHFAQRYSFETITSKFLLGSNTLTCFFVCFYQ